MRREQAWRPLVALLLLALLLTACERPLQPSRDTAPVEVATVAVPETVAEPTVPVGTPTPETVVVGATETPADQSPRPDATPTPLATPELTPEAAEAEETETEVEETEIEEAEEATAVDTPEAAAPTEPAATPPAGQAAGTPTTHTVAAGENLYRIGLRYGISWSVIAQHNNITNPNSIRVGQVLRIPGTEAIPVSTPALETTYIVQRGDNLYRIGQRFNVSWSQIAEANGLVNPNQVYVGQVLKIPVSAPGPTPQFTHVVTRGETLLQISLRYGVSWQSIAQANNLTAPYVIYVGQTLVIPGG